jgi:putative transposase
MARGPNPIEVILSEQEVQALEKCVKRDTTTQQIAQRVRIIQAAAAGRNNAQIARELGVSIDSVRLWRRRWVEWQEMPLEEYSVEIRLSDAARSGSPGKFNAEQVAQIIAIACEVPQDSGYPVSHWTPQEIAIEAEKRGIVVSISERQVGRFLKRGGSPTAS